MRTLKASPLCLFRFFWGRLPDDWHGIFPLQSPCQPRLSSQDFSCTQWHITKNKVDFEGSPMLGTAHVIGFVGSAFQCMGVMVGTQKDRTTWVLHLCFQDFFVDGFQLAPEAWFRKRVLYHGPVGERHSDWHWQRLWCKERWYERQRKG